MKLPALDSKKILAVVCLIFILLIILYVTGVLPNQRCEEKNNFSNKEGFGACPAGDYTASRAIQLGNKISGKVPVPSDSSNKRALVNDNNKLTINYNNDFSSTEIDTGSNGLVIDGGNVSTNSIIDIIKSSGTTPQKLLTMDKDGNVTISKTMTIGGTLTTPSTSSAPALPVTIGTSSATRDLTVTGATTLNNGLTVTGATTLNNGLTVTGATTLNNDLAVRGLTVTGATTLSGNTTIGTTSANKNLTVNGSLSSKQLELGPYKIWVLKGGYLDASKFTDDAFGYTDVSEVVSNPDNQKWYYNPITGVIKNANGKCLRSSGSKIILSDENCSGTTRATRFIIKDDKLMNQMLRTCLDAGNANRSSGCTNGENNNQGILFEPF